MSLLNDALRDLERRDADNRAPATAIPAGLRASARLRRSWWPGAIGGVTIAAATGLVFFVPDWQFLSAPNTDSELQAEAPAAASQTTVEVTQAPEAEPEVARVQVEPVSRRPEPVSPMTAEVTPAPEPVSAPPQANRSVQPEAADTSTPAPLPRHASAVTDERPTTMAGSDSPALARVSQTDSDKAPVTAPKPAETQPVLAQSETPQSGSGQRSEADASPSAMAVEPVKQRPQSAAAKDRQLVPRLERMLIEGNEVEAGRLLESAVGAGYPMPRSHATVARYYLAQERLPEARRWLPAPLVAEDLDLRLLQGRLTLMEDGPNAALAYLAAMRPEASKAPDYVATLASLYQQTGQYGQAGKHWVALLETNAQRADWWLGLALALDAQDQLGGARTAYSEALGLPDISPRLRSFAQSRLDALL